MENQTVVSVDSMHTSLRCQQIYNSILVRVVAVAFVFNWLGFFAAYCMTKTVAGRYGAISGFGLSVVKWVLILKVRIYLKSD